MEQDDATAAEEAVRAHLGNRSMDPAKRLELKVLARQEPMNAVIDLGDSPVQQFYRGATVLVTGGSGFLGKQLIEKLFRSCDIKKVYVLVRAKKGKSGQDRINEMVQDSVYDIIREKKSNFAELIEAIEGDISEIRLGINDYDWNKLCQEVNLIFHLAASIRFDEPLHKATLLNTRGPREVLTLAKQCKHLKCLVHISTAFSHATVVSAGKEIKEQFYPPPVPPQAMIELAEGTEETRLNSISNDLIKDWPNTYTFTKALAEELLRLEAGDVPVCIVRPPMVAPAYYEPSPGWGDQSIVFGPSGILLGVGLGVLHVFYGVRDKRLNYVPVDIVNNCIIAAPWDAMGHRAAGDKNIMIYNVSSSKCDVTWDFISGQVREESYKELCTPKAVWYCYLIETNNRLLFWLLTWLLHYIPAYVLDFVCWITGFKVKKISSFVAVFSKVTKVSKLFNYFFNYEWILVDKNLANMINKMTPNDQAIFNCNTLTIDYGEYMRVLGIGLRKYILKDGLKDSIKGRKRQERLFYANIVFLAVYAFLWVYVFKFCYWILKSVFSFIF